MHPFYSRVFTWVTFAILLQMVPAHSASEIVEGAFGNTISIVNSVGEETLVWLNRNHSYESKLPNGEKHQGIWTIDDDLICFKITKPESQANADPICGPLIANRKPGDQWESMVSDGSIVTITLKKGIVGKQ